jgi:phage baseplate assembly protein W
LTAVATALMRSSREELKRTEPRLRVEVIETSAATVEAIHSILAELEEKKPSEHSSAFLHTN